MTITRNRGIAMAVGFLLVLIYMALNFTHITMGEHIGPAEKMYFGFQDGSLTYAANSTADYSTLTDGNGTEGTDDHPYVEDRTCGNDHAVVTVSNNGHIALIVEDRDGCQGNGTGVETETNFAGHTTCKAYTTGIGFGGCGFYSGHGS